MPKPALAILIVTPAPSGSRKGNRITADRWRRQLHALGHKVRVREAYRGETCDLLIALHAVKSAASIRLFRQCYPQGELIVALTGTDVYGDLPASGEALASLRQADVIVSLQAQALEELPRGLRNKGVVILQSAAAPPRRMGKRRDVFEVCVSGHLREVKDPFRAAQAARLLPTESRIVITHVGGEVEPGFAEQARAEERGNARYCWLGELAHPAALRVLWRSRVLVISSIMEGAPNVASEAIRAGVPILSSRIKAMRGLLGNDYPGFFPLGDTAALAKLLRRCETERGYLERLRDAVQPLRRQLTFQAETRSWKKVIAKLPRGATL